MGYPNYSRNEFKNRTAPIVILTDKSLSQLFIVSSETVTESVLSIKTFCQLWYDLFFTRYCTSKESMVIFKFEVESCFNFIHV